MLCEGWHFKKKSAFFKKKSVSFKKKSVLAYADVVYKKYCVYEYCVYEHCVIKAAAGVVKVKYQLGKGKVPLEAVFWGV